MTINLTSLQAANKKFREICERDAYGASLIEFATYVWPICEPAIPFVRGWAVEAIAEHLEAVSHGHIRRLLINVPPGFT